MPETTNNWGQWVLLALFVVCFYVVWDVIYYRRLVTTGKIPLSGFFTLLVLMSLAFALFRLVQYLAVGSQR